MLSFNLLETRLTPVLSIYYIYVGHKLLKDTSSIFAPFSVTVNANCGHRETREMKRLVKSNYVTTHPCGCAS